LLNNQCDDGGGGGRTPLDWIGHWTSLDGTLDWTELRAFTLDWAGLDSTGLEWSGVDWMEARSERPPGPLTASWISSSRRMLTTAMNWRDWLASIDDDGRMMQTPRQPLQPIHSSLISARTLTLD